MAFSPWDNSTNCLTSDSINIYFLQYNIPCYQRTEQIYFFVVSSPPYQRLPEKENTSQIHHAEPGGL
jgi:hypothetical protein